MLAYTFAGNLRVIRGPLIRRIAPLVACRLQNNLVGLCSERLVGKLRAVDDLTVLLTGRRCFLRLGDYVHLLGFLYRRIILVYALRRDRAVVLCPGYGYFPPVHCCLLDISQDFRLLGKCRIFKGSGIRGLAHLIGCCLPGYLRCRGHRLLLGMGGIVSAHPCRRDFRAVIGPVICRRSPCVPRRRTHHRGRRRSVFLICKCRLVYGPSFRVTGRRNIFNCRDTHRCRVFCDRRVIPVCTNRFAGGVILRPVVGYIPIGNNSVLRNFEALFFGNIVIHQILHSGPDAVYASLTYYRN